MCGCMKNKAAPGAFTVTVEGREPETRVSEVEAKAAVIRAERRGLAATYEPTPA